ncbi:hypothetical protein ASF00_11075 [Sphingomonas sp. Leaf34]|nr:hypothetical protein ASF00_11075 [Sphingomonas sp. Leaf34]
MIAHKIIGCLLDDPSITPRLPKFQQLTEVGHRQILSSLHSGDIDSHSSVTLCLANELNKEVLPPSFR